MSLDGVGGGGGERVLGPEVDLGVVGLSDVGGLGGALGKRDGSGTSIALIVGLARGSGGRVQAPLGLQGLVNLLGRGELEIAGLLGDDGALMLRLEPGDKLGLESAGLLGVQVAHLLRNIDKRGNGLVMALLGALLSNTASTADLNRELLTAGITNKLARLLLNITSGARRLIKGPALLGALAVAHLLERLVALLDSLIGGLLLESNLTALLKVLLTDLLLGSLKLCYISVVALLNILVGALQDGVLLDGGDGLLLLHAAEAGVRVSLAAAEVNASGDSTVGAGTTVKLAAPPGAGAVAAVASAPPAGAAPVAAVGVGEGGGQG